MKIFSHRESNVARSAAAGTVVAGSVVGASLLFTAGMGIAGANPPPPPPPGQTADGLVTVTQGGSVVHGAVSLDEAATAVAGMCNQPEPAVGPLVSQVDTGGADQTICAGLPAGDVVVVQNGPPAPSPVVPNQDPAQQHVAPGQEPAASVPPGNQTPPGGGDLVTNPTDDPDFGIGGDQSVNEDQGLGVDDEQ